MMKNKEQFEFEFELDGHEFIELNNLLKFLSLANSGGEANAFIEKGKVKVNDEVETRKRHKLRAGYTVIFMDKTITIK
jgi:ribosome-associated protein